MKRKKRKELEFSTDNADYRLHLGWHKKASMIEDLCDADAIVLETGFTKYEDWDLGDLLYHPQYEIFIRENIELDEPKPIFFVDLPARKGLRDRGKFGYFVDCSAEAFYRVVPFSFSFASPFLLFLAIPFVSLESSLLSPKSKALAKINSYLSLSEFYTPSALGSAVSAKKIEENIAPEMKKRKKRKPEILIEYGAGHADIKPYLEHKNLRDFVINLHGFWNYYPRDKNYLDLIGEINFGDEYGMEGGEIIDEKSKEIDFPYRTYKKILYRIRK